MDEDSISSTAIRFGLDTPGDQIPLQERFFPPVQTSSRAYPTLNTIGTGTLLGVKWPACAINHPPPHIALRVKEQSNNSTPSLPAYMLLPLPLLSSQVLTLNTQEPVCGRYSKKRVCSLAQTRRNFPS